MTGGFRTCDGDGGHGERVRQKQKGLRDSQDPENNKSLLRKVVSVK